MHTSIYVRVVLSHFSCVRLFATPWTVACQSPLSMGLSRQEHWSRCHALFHGIFMTKESNSRVLGLLHWQAGFLTTSAAEEAHINLQFQTNVCITFLDRIHYHFQTFIHSLCISRASPLFSGFPCGSAGKQSACNVGDLGSIPGSRRSPGEGNGCPLQYSGLENSTDCIVHGVAKSWTGLSNFHFPLFSALDRE